ncbi:uncharacterized protein IL334_001642 [Kwoniella shivajii]|uniref:Uncharacterized protein n=1 Tax=Kwoniella shivajii TaxID=564305 RepID=A0ABZ1CT51_9TREE|nr:hypothetical protein IL334_001642 [Kwoniella shivajii]
MMDDGMSEGEYVLNYWDDDPGSRRYCDGAGPIFAPFSAPSAGSRSRFNSKSKSSDRPPVPSLYEEIEHQKSLYHSEITDSVITPEPDTINENGAITHQSTYDQTTTPSAPSRTSLESVNPDPSTVSSIPSTNISIPFTVRQL